MLYKRSSALFKAAKDVIPGGVNSPVRAFSAVGGTPIFAKSAKGAYVYDEDGNRYTHIINTKTGYPSKTNILSVSVIAKDCMTADGYATSFQVMGIDKVSRFLERHSELKAYIIYLNDENNLETLSLNGFPE